MSQGGSPAILADIGATNARFALLAEDDRLQVSTYAVADYASPIEALRSFLGGVPTRPTRAVIAAAGVVVDGRVAMTNAAWTVDSRRIKDVFRLDDVQIVNDFAAQALALPGLHATDLYRIGPGDAVPHGTMAVMGPGSGFGLAALAWGAGGETVLVTEGGHATLSSENRREDSIIAILRERLHHVSVERVLSGPGLVQLYHAVAVVDGLVARERNSAEIVQHALAGDCEASVATLEAFCAFLGGVAGNVALTMGATGGLFIAGGIAPRFTDFLRQSAFRDRFQAKGRLNAYLERIPTSVVVHPNPAFVGLTRLARVSRV